ncbi:AMP-binding protein [Alteromonas sp. 1_MG-2023]|uniref:AMP-binding protein n=1 Tax=Alteromonas sp. 1_MG-2023 TaxID=3062669 RepID=UPI0026E1B395|nr:AMP-binding protein [Alteromonas sp. 1_MG-2023]MDO6566971.1 AMP-binding protein [Alteromonas sp. 1_MG-2023]
MLHQYSLANWMDTRPSTAVAIRAGVTLTADEFIVNVCQWKHTLSQHSGQRWVVYHSDPYEFLSILYALWYLGRTACIPGDNRPATITRLISEADGGVGEMDAGITLDLSKPNTDFAHTYCTNAELANLPPIDSQRVAIELYTSGSSGKPKSFAKTLAQFDSELHSLHTQFPVAEGATVLSTVSHQHLYGLTFRLLRPFSYGQPFLCELCEYTEDIYHFAQQQSQYVLVSSPSHITRVNELLSWSSLEADCLNIFSAAAPLNKADALCMSKLLDAPLWEIYGSSETGVIAWRKQVNNNQDARWRRLPNVTFEIDNQGKVKVCSLFVDKHSPFLSDTLNIHSDGSFELQGRSDNIVKIEGKRVSLNAIAQVLMSHEWVLEAKAFAITRKRTEVASVIMLSKEGEKQLMLAGRAGVIKTLRTLLLSNFETIVVPRRWRFVDTMPYNQQSKVTLTALQALVEQPALLKWPAIKHISKDTLNVTISCTIPRDLVYLDGHFDQAPILPGVAQVHWAQKYADEYFDISGKFSHLEVVKFANVIQPDEDIDLLLAFSPEKQKVTFSYRSEKGVHSSGRICFA